MARAPHGLSASFSLPDFSDIFGHPYVSGGLILGGGAVQPNPGIGASVVPTAASATAGSLPAEAFAVSAAPAPGSGGGPPLAPAAAGVGTLTAVFGGRGRGAAGAGLGTSVLGMAASLAPSAAALGKLQFGLGDLYAEAQSHIAALSGVDRNAAASSFQSVNHAAPVTRGYVAIEAVASGGDGAALLAVLKSLGLAGGTSSGALVGGYMPLDSLDDMAALRLLAFARPAYMATNAGSVQSQDDPAMGTDVLRTGHPGIDGSGIRIGILSDSFDTSTSTSIHYADDVASGDLPAGVHILMDSAGGTDEGRAMAQLVHDVAPGADISFHTADGGQAVFAAGIAALAADGAKVIVDDIFYFAEPFFQDGIIAQAVDAVAALGVSYFSSAGNQASQSYQSVWRDSGQTLVDGGSTYKLFDFDPGPGIDVMQSFTFSGSSSNPVMIVLQWDSPFYSVSPASGGSQNDLALFIRDLSTGAVVGSFDIDNMNGDPVEIAGFTGSGTYGISIGLFGGPDPGLIKYVRFGGSFTPNEWDTRSPASYGHNNASGAISVGAADWFNTPEYGQTPPLGEYFTSQGGTPILFDTAGNRLATPQIRGVDLTAPDGGNTSFFGFDVAGDADTLPNFYGTSAAAPNAAALAVLLRQAFPGATRQQVEQAMKASAIDIQQVASAIGSHSAKAFPSAQPGFDQWTGAGLVQGPGAYATLGAIMTSVSLYDGSNHFVGTFSSIQAAIDAAADGDRIVAGAWTYAETLTVNKDVTIQGANPGIAGNAARGLETVIDGQVRIVAAGVTLDGVEIIGAAAGSRGTTGVEVAANGFTLTNSILDGSGDTAISTVLVTGLDLGRDVIKGYALGIAISDGSSTGSIHDNLFEGAGGAAAGLATGVDSATSHVSISGNLFDGLHGLSLNLSPLGPDSVLLDSYVTGNTIANSGAAPPVRIEPTNLTHTIAGTDSGELFDGQAAAANGVVGAFSFDGRGGEDQLFGGPQGDTLSGGDGADWIFGNGGNDMIDGGAGADHMAGGAGDDLYIVDDAGDVVTEQAGEGIDEVRTALATYALGNNVENLTGSGTGFQTLRGNGGNNVIIAGAGGGFIDLSAGGTDTGTGSGAADVFYFGAALDQTDQANGGAGKDVVAIQGDYSGGVTLGAGALVNVETLSILGHSDNRFGGGGASPFVYDVITSDANVGAGQQLIVNASTLEAGENFTFNGAAETNGNFFIYGGKGDDHLTGGSGTDVFFFAEEGRFGSGDSVDGGAGNDILVLRGNYTIDMAATSITNVETVTLMSGTDARFVATTSNFSYDITTADSTVAAGATMTFNGGGLRAGETLHFDGHLETDGAFRIFAGAGDDTITGGSGNDLIYGGLGADTLSGGGGNDVFRYQAVGESTAASHDQILDFASGDRTDLSRIDAISGTPGDDAFTFVGSAFTGHAGELIATNGGSGNLWVVSADVDGDGAADFQLFVTVADSHVIGASDFAL